MDPHFRSRRRKLVTGKTMPKTYESQQEALQDAERFQSDTGNKFLVQHSIAHRGKWVIVECREDKSEV